MNNAIHPVMQQALAPFMPKQIAVNTQSFSYTLAGVDLACEIECEAAERGTWDEPGWPADATLHIATVGGVNVYELLDDEQREEIEAAFLQQTQGD